jgi:dipeptidyl aminopeptidase/acylaminoacyl peptidase
VARAWIAVTALVALCMTADSAWASFPGRNGSLVYGWISANKYVGSPTEIRTVNPRSGRVRVLRSCPLRADREPSNYPDCEVFAPRYSPDGTRIAYSTVRIGYPPGQAWQYRPSLSLMAPDGTALADHATGARYSNLAWSPSGDRFLVRRSLMGGGYLDPAGIFLAELDGSELGQVALDWSQTPDWSSRGEIAFGRYDDALCLPGCEDIWVTRVGGTPRRLTHRGGSSPSWSPHGMKLAFVRRDRHGRINIHLIGRDGRGLRRLTRRGGTHPAWSPDGKRVAYIWNGDLFTIRASGKGARRLVDESGDANGGPAVESVDWQTRHARLDSGRGLDLERLRLSG